MNKTRQDFHDPKEERKWHIALIVIITFLIIEIIAQINL